MTKFDLIWIGTGQATGTVVPRLAKSGKTVAIVESGRNILMVTKLMKNISRAKEKDETDGLVKVLVDADTEQFLGAAILGVGGDEIINMFTPFMYTRQAYKLFRQAVLIHPTVAELMPWTLDDLKPLAEA